MFAIEEKDRRKPGWKGDVEVKLCDGQVWYLPRPRVRFNPVEANGDGVSTKLVHSFGMEYVAKVEAWHKCLDDEASLITDYANVLMDLSVALLRLNYDLTIEEVGQVLWFDFGTPEDADNLAMREVLIGTAMGMLPKKTSETGSGST
jgi:hypothetical protein